jgi:hypothetical protein
MGAPLLSPAVPAPAGPAAGGEPSPPGQAGVGPEPAGLTASVVLVTGPLVGVAVVGSLAGVAAANNT